jgi:long-chain acyl-CoA synthetase
VSFWVRAAADPSWIAVVEPDGTQVTAGELLGRVNRLTSGLQARGLRPGDGIAALLPNGAAAFEVMLAAAQGGWYLTPLNWHFAAPELAYILTDSEARAFFVAERFAELGAAAAELAGLPPGAPRASAATCPASPPRMRRTSARRCRSCSASPTARRTCTW